MELWLISKIRRNAIRLILLVTSKNNIQKLFINYSRYLSHKSMNFKKHTFIQRTKSFGSDGL